MNRAFLKKALFYTATILFGLVVSLGLGELIIRYFSPQPYMYPRFRYSEQYGALVYPNTDMVDAWPGRYEYHYAINEEGFRGKVVPVSSSRDRTNIVILGDSNAFGKGVNEGEEFPQVMQRALQPDYTVVNLAMIGFGLTQQIRSYYEFGRRYRPGVVLLQFCDNDPSDNLENTVTDLSNGKLVFRNTNSARSMQLRTLNSRSILQKSQLYNFLRFRVLLPAYNFARTGTFGIPAIKDGTMEGNEPVEPAISGVDGAHAAGVSVLEEEIFYNKLLDVFADTLKAQGTRFLMISVNGQLEKFPTIMREVRRLDAQGLLEYVEVRPWFEGVTDYGSPEGHVWGTKGHQIVGEHLARILRMSR